MRLKIVCSSLLILGCPVTVYPNEVEVLDVAVSCRASCTFSVTLQHADEGWKHYADRWEILTPEGEILATRVLHHPHVNEQPFTRSLSNVQIPPGLSSVRLRGHDSLHGYSTSEFTVKLPK